MNINYFHRRKRRKLPPTVLVGVLFALSAISVLEVKANTHSVIANEVWGNTMAGRESAAASNDTWIADAKGAGITCFYQLHAITGDGNFSDTHAGDTNAEIQGDIGPVQVTISNRDMTDISDTSDLGERGGSVSIGTSLGKSLQDDAPMPDPNPSGDGGTDGWYRVINNGSQWEYWNETSGASDSRNAVLFEFDTPVDAFGAFFGDVETRTDGYGTTALLRYKVTGGSVYEVDIPTSTSTANQSSCGGATYEGCGNRATRWIGIYGDNNETFDWMIVIVGDDDAGSSNKGYTEHISWVGATVGARPSGGNCPTSQGGSGPTAVRLAVFAAKPASMFTTGLPLLAGIIIGVLAWLSVRRRNA